MDERIWTDAPLTMGNPLTLGATSISMVQPPETAYLISGDLQAAQQLLHANAPMLGLLNDCLGMKSYVIRINRDSELLVSHNLLDLQSGWHTEGFGLSDATDLYAIFKISGREAELVLAQGGIGDVSSRSASAAVMFANVTTLLVRNKTRAMRYGCREPTLPI